MDGHDASVMGATSPDSADTIAGALARMAALQPLVAGDARRHFHATYLRTTRAVARAAEDGRFLDRAWVERWDARFASFYLDALEAAASGSPVPEPWRIAFAAADDTHLPPLRHVLLGMNAHINFDLPQAIVAVVSPAEFTDAAVRARREQDHRRVDEVLAARVSSEDHELKAVEAPGTRTLLDRALTPVNRRASRRFITEAREKVWHNAAVLDTARRRGPAAYDDAVRRLEALSAARVADLRRRGQVVLRLARHGFGVRLARQDPVEREAGA